MLFRICSQNPKVAREEYLGGGKIVDNELIELPSSSRQLSILALSKNASEAIMGGHCNDWSLINKAKRYDKKTFQFQSR